MSYIYLLGSVDDVPDYFRKWGYGDHHFTNLFFLYFYNSFRILIPLQCIIYRIYSLQNAKSMFISVNCNAFAKNLNELTSANSTEMLF